MRKTILLTFALLCMIVQLTWAQTSSIVAFKTYSWNEEKYQLVSSDDTHEATKLSATMYQLGDGWYSVDESFTYNNRVIIKGDVKIILRDNTTLTASRGIKVNSSATLTIYAQSDGEEMGKLVARTTANDWAAIGGEKNDLAGSVIIHGGDIDAKANYKYGAGIGGGYGDGSGMKEITIYGGFVTANAVDNGAAIGAAKHNNHVGTINIYGGIIKATGGKYAAGIGGAEDRGGWKTNIYGGIVFATGGEDGAGIGGGYDGDGGNHLKFYGGEVYATGGEDGAAIGGGYKGDGGNIVITGGCIEATTSDLYIDHAAAPIGAGNKGNAGSITIDGSAYVFAKIEHPSSSLCVFGSARNSKKGTFILGDHKLVLAHNFVPVADRVKVCLSQQNSVIIDNCYHIDKDKIFTLGEDPKTHIGHCKYCKYVSDPKPHNYSSSGYCYDCGYQGTFTTVTTYEAAEDGTGYDDGITTKEVIDRPYWLPEIHRSDLPSYMTFEGWLQDPATTPDTWETAEGETLLMPDTQITPTAEVKLYARYSYHYGQRWTWAEDNRTATLEVINLEDNSVVATITDPSVIRTVVVPTLEIPGTITSTATANYTDSKGRSYTFTDTQTEPTYWTLNLGEEDNASVVNANDGALVTVKLSGRTLHKDGRWNTLCLPFDVVIENSPLAGAAVKEFESASFDNSIATMTLSFTNATDIKAGRPYLIKWDSGNDLGPDDLVFPGVILNSDNKDESFQLLDGSLPQGGAAGDYTVTFRGAYSKVTCYEDSHSTLFLDADDQFVYPASGTSIGAQRAHFQLSGFNQGDISTFVLYIADAPKAIWCSDSQTLYFDYLTTPVTAGSTYNGETVTDSWSGYIIKDTGTSSPDWRIPASEAHKVVFTENFRQVEPASLSSWFYGFKFLTTIEGIENLNTHAVANMNSTFHSCSSLETINLSGFDVSRVYEASGMFRNCSSLTTIYCNDTWNIGSSYDMFTNCEKLKGAVPYDASKVTGAMANPETGYFTKTDATGIDFTTAPTPMDEKHGCVYTLQGIRISPESMRKGYTYIYNGKKVVR